MKQAVWKKMIRRLLPDEVTWGFKDRVAFVKPLGDVLYGVGSENSAFGPDVYLWQVRVPLYTPSDSLALDWSERLGRGRTIHPGDESSFQALMAPAVARAVDEFHDPKPLIAYKDPGRNVLMLEDLGYSYVLFGKVSEALECLSKVEAFVPEYEWDERMCERATRVATLLRADRHDEALQQLVSWRKQTMGALGLPSD